MIRRFAAAVMALCLAALAAGPFAEIGWKSWRKAGPASIRAATR